MHLKQTNERAIQRAFTPAAAMQTTYAEIVREREHQKWREYVKETETKKETDREREREKTIAVSMLRVSLQICTPARRLPAQRQKSPIGNIY